jgi:hypothetical protein
LRSGAGTTLDEYPGAALDELPGDLRDDTYARF